MNKSIETVVGYAIKLLTCLLVLFTTQVQSADLVNITLLESAVTKGAVCLDGSPPAYAYVEGFGEGATNWIVYIQGGGWCDSIGDCVERTKGMFGSSLHMNKQTFFSGLLDGNNTFNPDFYNWHKFYILYCDGSSFMSDVEEIDPETNLTFRGARIFNAMMEELLDKGMGNAQNAILTGTSAGGLTTILHCDMFQTVLPNADRVKCISDSGFFIHGEDLIGADLREQRYAGVVETHKIADSLPTSCTAKMNPNLCLFPENLVGDIQAPLFLLESAFDSWQIKENLIPVVGGQAEWSGCTKNLTNCNSTQLGTMKDFGIAFIETLQNPDDSSRRGMFVHSCYLHGHLFRREGWICSSVVGNNVLANKTIGQAVGDWYFDRSCFQEVNTQNDTPRNCTNLFNGKVFEEKCLAALPDNGSEDNNK